MGDYCFITNSESVPAGLCRFKTTADIPPLWIKNNGLTVSYWAKHTKSVGPIALCIELMDGSATNNRFYFGYSGGKAYTYIYRSGAGPQTFHDTTATCGLNAWNHNTVVITPTGYLYLYCNGAYTDGWVINGGLWDALVDFTVTSITVGGRRLVIVPPVPGGIKHLAVYGEALEEEDAIAIYNNGTPPNLMDLNIYYNKPTPPGGANWYQSNPHNLMLWYPFDEADFTDITYDDHNMNCTLINRADPNGTIGDLTSEGLNPWNIARSFDIPAIADAHATEPTPGRTMYSYKFGSVSAGPGEVPDCDPTLGVLYLDNVKGVSQLMTTNNYGTMSFWAKLPASLSRSGKCIWSQGSRDNDPQFTNNYFYNTKFFCGLNGLEFLVLAGNDLATTVANVVWEEVGSPPLPFDNVWHHFVLGWSQNDVYLYIDGIAQIPNIVSLNTAYIARHRIAIHELFGAEYIPGTNVSNNGYYAFRNPLGAGEITDICYFNRVLNAEEIPYLYAASPAAHPDPKLRDIYPQVVREMHGPRLPINFDPCVWGNMTARFIPRRGDLVNYQAVIPDLLGSGSSLKGIYNVFRDESAVTYSDVVARFEYLGYPDSVNDGDVNSPPVATSTDKLKRKVKARINILSELSEPGTSAARPDGGDLDIELNIDENSLMMRPASALTATENTLTLNGLSVITRAVSKTIKSNFNLQDIATPAILRETASTLQSSFNTTGFGVLISPGESEIRAYLSAINVIPATVILIEGEIDSEFKIGDVTIVGDYLLSGTTFGLFELPEATTPVIRSETGKAAAVLTPTCSNDRMSWIYTDNIYLPDNESGWYEAPHRLRLNEAQQEYAIMPLNPLVGNVPWTIELWVKELKQAAEPLPLISTPIRNIPDTSGFLMYIDGDTRGVGMWFGLPAPVDGYSLAKILWNDVEAYVPHDTWTNIVVTYNGTYVVNGFTTGLKLYINGIEKVEPYVAPFDNQIPCYFNVQHWLLNVGYLIAPFPVYGTMEISALRIYSSALSAASIAQNYNAEKGFYL